MNYVGVSCWLWTPLPKIFIKDIILNNYQNQETDIGTWLPFLLDLLTY